MRFSFLPSCQGSSVVEQGTHKPLVGSSNLPPGSFDILRGSSGRHYIGSCVDLETRFAQHLRGHRATTKRLEEKLEIVEKKRWRHSKMPAEPNER
jgi:GIY-YIG catalytic domain